MMALETLQEAGRAVLFWLGALYALWFFYLAVMNLKRAKDAGTLSRLAFALGLPFLVCGYVLDLAVNVVVGSVLFVEWPRIDGLTLTARLSRHIGEASWRGALARWICGRLLDTFDPSGRHCK